MSLSCVSLRAFHMSLQGWHFSGWPELWPTITFVYDLHLTNRLCHLKDGDELFELMPFYWTFDMVKFWSFFTLPRSMWAFQILLDLYEHSWILLDHFSPLGGFWTSKRFTSNEGYASPLHLCLFPMYGPLGSL
jgi:hypothetical protein